MHKWLVSCVTTFLFLIGTLSVQAADTYTFDPSHSFIFWHVNHLGFSNQSGKWPFTGTVVLDEAKPQNSKVDVTVHTADVISGVPKLDEHLRGPQFLNSTQFPSATYTSQKVVLTGKHSAKVIGTLTFLGISKPLRINVTLNKMGINPLSEKNAVGFSATTELLRSDYGNTTLASALSDEVKINIEAEAVLNK